MQGCGACRSSAVDLGAPGGSHLGMFTLQEYAANFAPHPVPGLLAKLYEFQSEHDDFFSDGFELIVEDKSALHSWSEAPEFLDALFPFAQANGSGSTYALWLREGGSLDDAPVVIFGDEGGVHLVAENLATLLRLLGYDQEPMVGLDEVYYFKAGDIDPDEEDGESEDEDEDEDEDEAEDDDDEDEDDEDDDDEDDDDEDDDDEDDEDDEADIGAHAAPAAAPAAPDAPAL